MKTIVIPIVTFIAGIAIGVSSMLFAGQKGPNQVIANMRDYALDATTPG